MILQHASRVVWMSHLLCAFDWNDLDKYHPDEVWWMPTERFLVCLTGQKPKGLPERKGSRPEESPRRACGADRRGGDRDGARQ